MCARGSRSGRALSRADRARGAAPGPGRAGTGSRSSLSGPRAPRSELLVGPGSWRSARAAESARLEIVCGETHRGFKSHFLRRRADGGAGGAPACRLPYRGAVNIPSSTEADAQAMRMALVEARSAPVHGDVPVGAVALVGGTMVASRHNERELRQDPTAHAEILALRDAAQALGTWRLSEVTLVVTLEPCAMCAGALVNGFHHK